MQYLKIQAFFCTMLMLLSGLSGTASAQSGKGILKIISYNVLDGMSKDSTKGKTQFAAFLKAAHPDMVGFQELNGFTKEKLQALASLYGHPYVVVMTKGTYKVGLTSRFPITDVQIRNDSMSHGYIMAQTGGYHVMVAHLDPHSYAKRRTEIAIMMRAYRQNHKSAGERWLLMGDLNSFSPLDKDFYAVDDRRRQVNIRDEKIHAYNKNLINGTATDFQVQQTVLDNGWVDSYHFKGHTLQSSETTGRIDYIYISRNLAKKVIASDFITDQFTHTHSDHRPMALILRR